MTRLRIPASFDADVVVAGGGPAGASAAARLAAAGARVIVLDQRSFPRDKVCGDFVGPAAIVELEALGVTARPDYAASNIIRQAALFLDGHELIRRRLPEVESLPSYGRCIPRMQLDHWLLEAASGAGAQIMPGACVHGFDVTDDAIVVRAESGREPRRLRARLLIGADGSSSVVARQLRGEGPADENRIIAVRAYYEGITTPEDRCDLYFSAPSFPGYYWLFPTGAGEANVGVGMVLRRCLRPPITCESCCWRSSPAIRRCPDAKANPSCWNVGPMTLGRSSARQSTQCRPGFGGWQGDASPRAQG